MDNTTIKGLDLMEEIIIQRCIDAGKNEPDSSFVRSAWKSIGFYLPKKNVKLVKTWRR